MSYAYTTGDGVSALDATKPDGSLEYVASLDDAVRQIKAYLTDSSAGPDALIGTLSNLSTTAKGSLVAALNEVYGLVQTADTEIGDLSLLHTALNSNLVSALNEVLANQGSLASLSTTSKASLSAAINELFARFSPAVNSSGKLLAAAVTAGFITNAMLGSGLDGGKFSNASVGSGKLAGNAKSAFGTDGSGAGISVGGSNGHYLRKNPSTGDLEFAAVPGSVFTNWFSTSGSMPSTNSVASVSHGLGGIPRMAQVLFRAQAGVTSPLVSGQYLQVQGLQRNDGYEEDQSAVAVWYDDTKIYLRRGNENDFKIGGIRADFGNFDVVYQAAL